MPRRIFTAIFLFVAWSLPGLIGASINVAIFPEILKRSPAWVYFAAQIGTWWPWALFTPLIVWMVRRYPLEGGRWRDALWPHLALLGIALLVFIATSAGWAKLGQMTAYTKEAPESYFAFLRGYIGSRLPLGTLAYAFVAGVTMAADERLRRRENELQTVKLRAELARAQLQALQMQLQPHFLFNTLHAISILIDEQPAIASRTIIRLADLLRQTLALADVPEITLARELEILGRYLEIEMTRFGDRLSVNIDVPHGLLGIPVPSFVLQPVVENAVRHGVAPRVKPGCITIRGSLQGDTLILQVEDDGPGFTANGGAPPSDAGIGLSATRERLAVRYGNAARVICTDSPNGGARVTLEIPAVHV